MLRGLREPSRLRDPDPPRAADTGRVEQCGVSAGGVWITETRSDTKDAKREDREALPAAPTFVLRDFAVSSRLHKSLSKRHFDAGAPGLYNVAVKRKIGNGEEML